MNRSYDFNKKILLWHNFHVPVEYVGIYYLLIIFIVAYFFGVMLEGVCFVMAEKTKFDEVFQELDSLQFKYKEFSYTVDVMTGKSIDNLTNNKDKIENVFNSVVSGSKNLKSDDMIIY